MRAQARLLPDGRRLHLQDGPIDLILDARGASWVVEDARGASWAVEDARGASWAVERAYQAAVARFATVLDELCAELPLLRTPAQSWPRPALVSIGAVPDGADQGEPPRSGDLPLPPAGAVARRMAAAVVPFAAETFITPMAAVAGAVAEEILEAMTAAAALERASVNNGGDVALHLAPGKSVRIGMVDRPDRPSLFGHVVVDAASPVRGIATSGWRGRSFSFGIADAVTVLARTPAAADAAATVVANAVDLPGHPAVTRVSAASLQPDSDLGLRLVTRDVDALRFEEIARALAAGQRCARDLIGRGLILGAALHLQGVTRTVGSETLVARPRRPEALRLQA